MDFFTIKEKTKGGALIIYPEFNVCRSKDIMVRGRAFYAIWDEDQNVWSTDEYDVQRLVDSELEKRRQELADKYQGLIIVNYMREFSNNMWSSYRKFVSQISDNSHQLDTALTFSDTEVVKKDYVSKRLAYPLKEGSFEAYNEIIGTLYDPDERDKLEWAIGAIVAGDAKNIQKFVVLYGEAGTGKSTILNIIQMLFDGYYTTFEAKALTSSSNAFSTEVFRSNPLVAIQHDGDLSKIEDNTKLNSIVSHEEMTINEKYKSSYTSRINCFLFMGTNRPVKITDAKSGIIRRLIDVTPSGRKIPPRRYQALMSQVGFELSGIAAHCLEVYRELGKNYYSSYRPINMIFQTDVFFNFVESNYYTFKEQDGCTLSQAYDMYKTYCDDSLVEFKLPRHKFREELKDYFHEFFDVTRVEGKQVRSYYKGFIFEKFTTLERPEKEEHQCPLVIDNDKSLFDELYSDQPAQYATSSEKPKSKWSEVETKLKDIDTSKVHYVMLPENHIVIDFDLKDDDGKKSMDKNLEAASKWPPTYAEFSKSGKGIHLHYIYDGDASKLSRVYADSIEVKVFTGNASLRRRFTKSNGVPIATISSGLPMKGEKMINFEAVKSERGLRELIKRNLRKEIHPGTKPSVDFIYKILEDAYSSGLKFDVTDMRPAILVFANNSTNQAQYCVKMVGKMHFKSEEPSEASDGNQNDDRPITFFDVEVFPNLFLVNWKYEGADQKCVRMINPKPEAIEELLKHKLVAFNNRRYDNHILYARYIGYTNEQLYQLSQRLISGSKNAMFGEAYNISYTDVYDFASAGNKKSLKKFEIELGLHHQELGLPWDEPVPEDKWPLVSEYCDNDVISLEAVFNHLQGDWTARQILAEISGLTVNHTTNQHSYKIIFDGNKTPQNEFCYRDLSKPVTSLPDDVIEFLKENTEQPLDFTGVDGGRSMLPYFPGYKFELGKSSYRDEDPGEGGYVYAEPGIYYNVALLDVASMHPSSLEDECLFGPKYTKRFSDLKKGRLYIKHKDLDGLKTILSGKLVPFAEAAISGTGKFTLDDLSNALKTVINSVYGLTSAKFENQFRDPRNIDNIVAKRGALFMINLKHEVQARGYTVAHIKTDSIKIPNASKSIINFVMEYGKKYGYEFEHEATYEKMCLVNDAVYIARYDDKGVRNKGGKKALQWTPTGAQFAHPYVFKTLFSKEKIEPRDMWETRSVKSALYLDFNEGLPEDEHNYTFVGKVGAFYPIKAGQNAGVLLSKIGDKYNSVTGSKGYRWLEAEVVDKIGNYEVIDKDYYRKLVDKAVETISKYGDPEQFLSDESVYLDRPPWCDDDCNSCKMKGNCPDELPF